MGQLIVERCTVLVTGRELGLTRDTFTKARLRAWLKGEVVARGGWAGMTPMTPPPDLQDWVDNFSETYSLSAVGNLAEFFRRLTVSGLTPGGRRGASVPLVYDPRRLLPNASELGAVGEGLAGFYLEKVVGLIFVVRPFGVNPDFVFVDKRNGSKHLVQVKTTLGTKRSSDLTEAINLLDVLAKTKLLRRGKYVADLVSVRVRAIDDFSVRHFGIEDV